MAKNFSNLRTSLSPEAQAKSKAKTDGMLAEMPLHALRKARGLSQPTLAERLHVPPSTVTKKAPDG